MSRPNKGKSPYAAKGKTPHKYSELYDRWVSAPDDESRIRADRAFRRHFGVPLCWKGGRAVMVS